MFWEIYKEKRYRWITTGFFNGAWEMVCIIENWPGIWHSEKGLKQYIDFVKDRPYHPYNNR